MISRELVAGFGVDISGASRRSSLGNLLPLLQTELFHAEWKHRECGILALGAVAEGCMSGIEPHLPTLIPYLISTLKDPKVSQSAYELASGVAGLYL